MSSVIGGDSPLSGPSSEIEEVSQRIATTPPEMMEVDSDNMSSESKEDNKQKKPKVVSNKPVKGKVPETLTDSLRRLEIERLSLSNICERILLDEINSNNPDGKDEAEIEAMISSKFEELDKVNKHIERIQLLLSTKSQGEQASFASVSQRGGTAMSKWASGNGSSAGPATGGVIIKFEDLPRLQFKHQDIKDRPFPKYSAFETVNDFFSELETLIEASRKNIENEWRTMLPSLIQPDLREWFKSNVRNQRNWSAAKEVLRNRFTKRTHLRQAKLQIFNACIGPYETVRQYHNRFANLVKNAGYQRNQETIIDCFLCGVPETWQSQIQTVMESRAPLREKQKQISGSKMDVDDANWEQQNALDLNLFTFEEIGNIAETLFGERKPINDSDYANLKREKRPRDEVGEKNQNSSHRNSRPEHGKKVFRHYHEKKKQRLEHAASSTKTDAKSGVLKNNFLGSKNEPHRATGSQPTRLCRYCQEPWQHMHKCDAYYQQTGKSQPTILSLSVENDKTSSARQNEERLVKEIYEDEAYKCEYQKEILYPTKSKNTDNLITPIILNRMKLCAQIDTGSPISCINKYILDKYFKNKIQLRKTYGSLKDLSGKTTKRIGQTEPMTLRYINDISCEHQFEVVEFDTVTETEFDVLLGRDILPKMNISLQGVAYRWPDDPEKEDAQFENINFDTNNSYDPDNADYGSENERKDMMVKFEDEIQRNKEIPKGAFCTVPESIIKIPMKENVNCYKRQYKLADRGDQAVKEQIETWLEQGVAVKAPPSGRYNSPLMTTPKKDEFNQLTKTRVCCDLRIINDNIDHRYQENYAVPKIKEIFERVCAKGKIFTRIDLANAYHSFKVDEGSQEVLSFTYNRQTYRFARCPYGLKFVTSLFSRVMNIILGDLEGVETYVDDCILYSETAEEHVALINEVMKRLTDVNLKINFDKCAWFKTSIRLLGFVVGGGITTLDMSRLSNIDQWPIPKDAKQVRSICGVISYMRDYAPMLSKVMAPLDQLRNEKDITGKWTQEHTNSFNAIKKILLSKAILHTPDMSKKFYLECDASAYGIACALTQRDELNRTKHIAFVSRSLTKHERNWSTNRRETAAIIFGLEKFRSLLWGQNIRIQINTDHIALVHMFTTPYPNSTIQQYMETLSEFNIVDVVHLKGIQNKLPDLLSRVYPPIPLDKTLEEENDRQIKKLQKSILLKRARDDNKRKEIFVKRKEIRSRDKDLHVLAVKLSSDEYKSTPISEYVCPPQDQELRNRILEESHEKGHFGMEAMIKHVHTYHGLHWNSIYDECREIIKKCKPCQMHNITRKGYNPQKSTVCFEPFSVIAMDLLGPLPVTENGNVYILVVMDICTRYIIARPLQNKQSDTVARALVNIFGDYGVASLISFISDNGREFKNSLMHKITSALKIKHRFSTAFYPQSNGSAENSVKQVINTLRKMCGNDASSWDERLSIVQLCLNMKVKSRTGSTPFSLMYARQVQINGVGDKDKTVDPTKQSPLSVDELEKRAEHLNTIVFPAIKERTMKIVEEQNKRFNKHHQLVDIPVDTPVMIRLAEGRKNKLAPLYSGPYTVVRKTAAGTYVLKDETNELLHRDYVPSELKVVSIDETAIEDEVYEVEDIRDHRRNQETGEIEYLTKWVGYGERENTWLTEDAFTSPDTLAKYRAKLEKLRELERQRDATIQNKSLTTEKNKPQINPKPKQTKVSEVVKKRHQADTSPRRSKRFRK